MGAFSIPVYTKISSFLHSIALWSQEMIVSGQLETMPVLISLSPQDLHPGKRSLRATGAYIYVQVNEKGHIGIVENVQENSLDTDIHNNVHICHYCTA